MSKSPTSKTSFQRSSGRRPELVRLAFSLMFDFRRRIMATVIDSNLENIHIKTATGNMRIKTDFLEDDLLYDER